MKPQLTFRITPQIPARLDGLAELAMNLWWSWEPKARRLFFQIDPQLWEQSRFSPLKVLQGAPQERLEQLAKDDVFLREFDFVMKTFRGYLARPDTWARRHLGTDRVPEGTVAYFSAEFGFHESMPIYSGGLGILSGDHCKSASDLGLDFVAVGLLYRHGYFRQQIDGEGWQQAVEMDLDFHQLPISRATDAAGNEVAVQVELPGRSVTAQVWQLRIGRIRLLLLDTDTPANSEGDRKITYQLYGGDKVMRINQEIVLGVGGVRALEALGIEPAVCHMNEGHSAFLSLERIRRVMEDENLSFHAALQQVAASNVFTTHTPVPAGNDAFAPELIRQYFADYTAQVGIDLDELLRFGRIHEDAEEEFSMTVLALRCSRHANGVSALHGEVSRGMWQDVWYGVPLDEVPITSITNGIHTKTWLSSEIGALYDKHLGTDWEEHLIEPEWWSKVIDIPASELWTTHQVLKKRLIEFARERIAEQRRRNKENPAAIRAAGRLLDPEILTIGFARRFATYKRATLLFDDPERLEKILNHPERPVQFLFAGKSHPADDGGKAFIQKVIEFTRRAGFANRVAFIEDYDHRIGRRLYQGVDLWLNNPLRPLEASGTSGMKLPPNGGINLSVLDGWWCEAFNRRNGWAIGEEITEGSLDFQNEVDAESLYNLLENQIVPLYYAKPDGLIPSAWIELMRESMRSIVPAFNTHRMVSEYATRLYAPAAAAGVRLRGPKNDGAPAAALSQWKNQLRNTWPQVRVVEGGIAAKAADFTSGQPVPVRAVVALDGMAPDSVLVEAWHGPLNERDDIQRPRVSALQPGKPGAGGSVEFTGELANLGSGSYGLLFRVTPASPLLTQKHETRLIRWSQE